MERNRGVVRKGNIMKTKKDLLSLLEDVGYGELKEVVAGIKMKKTSEKEGIKIFIEVECKGNISQFQVWEEYDTDSIYFQNNIDRVSKMIKPLQKLAQFLEDEVDQSEKIIEYRDKTIEVIPEEIKEELYENRGKIAVLRSILDRDKINLEK